MPFNANTLQQARSLGAKDDEIFDDISSKDERFRIAREQGASLDDIAKLIEQKGGGKTNVQDQTGANSDRNAEREANQQVGNRNEAINTSGEEPRVLQDGGSLHTSESGGQEAKAELNVKPSFQTGGDSVEEIKRKQAIYAKKGQEGRQAIPVEDDAWNKAKLNVDAFPTQTIGEKFGEGMKQAPPERGLVNLFASGGSKGVLEFGQTVADVTKGIKTPLNDISDTAEMIFGKNSFSDKVKQLPYESANKFKELAKSLDLNETEQKSTLDGFVFGVGSFIPDALAAIYSGGESAISTATKGLWKPIAEKAVHGVKAFLPSSIKAMNVTIDDSLDKGKTHEEALVDGTKALIESEAGAALPLQVSSGLSNTLLRGASRFLQAVPLVVAQQELAQKAGELFNKDKNAPLTFSENLISGNLGEAGKQLLQAAPMGVLGAAGESTYKKPVNRNVLEHISEAGLPSTAEEFRKQTSEQGGVTNIPAATPEDLAQAGEAPATELPPQPPSTPIEAAMQMGLSESDAQAYVQNLKEQGIPDDQIIQLAVDQKTGNEQLAQEAGDQQQAARDLAEKARKGDIDAVNELRKQRGLKPKQGPQPTTPSETKTEEPSPSGVSAVEGEPPVEQATTETKEGTPQREGEGKEEVVPAEPPVAEEVNHDQAREQTPVLLDHKIKDYAIQVTGKNGKTSRKIVNRVVEIWKDSKGNIIEGQSFGENLNKQQAAEMRKQLNKESDIVKKAPQKGWGTWGEDPIIKFLIDNKVMSRTEAIKKAKRTGDPLEASYDKELIPKLADNRHNEIYGGSRSIDDVLGEIVQEGWLPEDAKPDDLWAYIEKASSTADNVRKQEAFQMKKWGDEAKKAAAEERKAAKAGKTTTTPETLEQKADAYIKQSQSRVYTANPFLIVAMMYKAAASIARGTIKFAPWAAKMLQERGKAVREVLHEAWVKGKILHEELFQRKLSEESKKPAARFVESPKGTRVMSAAYRDPETGIIHEGKDHESAMTNAGRTPISDPEARETDDFGFMTDKGEFISRDKAREVGEKSKQVLPKSMSGREKLHSIDINLSAYNSKGERVVDPMLFSERPKAAVAQQLNLALEKMIKDSSVLREIRDGLSGRIPNMSNKSHRELLNTMRKMQLTHDDMESLGIKIPPSRQIDILLESTKKSAYMFTDFIGNKKIARLDRAGVFANAYELAYSRAAVTKLVNDLIADVFGADYKNTEKMKRTMEVIVNDNILGGYDQAQRALEKINKLIEDNKGTSKKADMDDLYRQQSRMTKFIDEIEDVRNIAELNASVEAAKLDPEIVGHIENWKQKVAPTMEELYRTMKGIKKDQKINEDLIEETRGRHFGARINLLPESEIESVVGYHDHTKPMPNLDVTDFLSPIRASYRNPDVKYDKFLNRARFTDEYSTDPFLILTNSIGTRHHEASKINFYDALVANGSAYLVPASEKGPNLINGKPVQIREIKYPVFNNETGETTLRTFNLHVDADLKGELDSVLGLHDASEPNPLFRGFTSVQMIGIADATSHLKNLQAVLATSLGRDSIGEDLISKIPFVGSSQTFSEVKEICKLISADSPEIRKELAQLAKQGLVRQTMPAEGIQKILGMHDLIHNVDTAARIIMSRRYENLVKNYGAVDSLEGKIKFVNQLGEYNRKLMGRFEAMARDYGASPFIVAGRAMDRFARRSVIGEYGFKTETTRGAITARAAQMSGLVFASIIPMMANMALNGNPMGRTGTPIGAIDFGPRFDTDDGKHRVFDLFQLIGLRRGMRQLGINAALEGIRNGKDWEGIAQDAQNDILTTSAHAFVGPAFGAVVEGLSGQRIDLRSGYGQSFSARKIEHGSQLVENFRTALKHLNAPMYGVGAGIDKITGKVLGMKEGPMQSMLTKVGVPKDVEQQSIPKEILDAGFSSPLSAIGLNLRGIVSPALKMASQLGQKQMYTPEQDIRYQARKNVLDAYQRKDKDGAKQIYLQYKKDGVLTAADDKALKSQIQQPNLLIKRVKMLKTPEEAVRVFRVGDGKEQDDILPSVLGKIARSSTLSTEEKINMAKSLKGYLKKDSKFYRK